jgi:hypothetical protein
MKIHNFKYIDDKEIVIDTIYDIEIKYYNISFSNMFNKNLDHIESEIKRLKKELNNRNFDLDKFMLDNKDIILKDDDFINNNGFMDILLYQYFKDDVSLSGYKLEDQNDEEFYIKYTYGYHNYNLGRKFILQSFDSIDDYFKETSEKFLNGLSDLNYIKDKNIIKYFSEIKNISNCYVVFISIPLLYKYAFNNNNDNIVSLLQLNNTLYSIKNDILVCYIGNNKVHIPDSLFNKITEDIYIKYQMLKYNL